VNASLETSNSPWTLTNANGEFTITGDRLRIETFRTDAGEDSISATGEISYRPAVQFNLAVNAEGLRLVYPDGIRSGLAANLALTGTTKSSTLSGRVTVTDVSFLPDFNLSNFTSKFETGLSSPEASRFERNLHLNVTIQSVSQINLESSKISIYGSLTDLPPPRRGKIRFYPVAK
jgi:autotransporter translocation and assembly factor TamB